MKTSLSLSGNKLLLDIPYPMRHLAKKSGAIWDANQKLWVINASPFAVDRIVSTFQGIEMDHSVESLIQRREIASKAKDAEDLSDIPGASTKPWKHQLQAYHFSMESDGGVMLAHGMGAGKSFTTISIILNKGFKQTLILCPTSVISAWVKQFRVHARAHIDQYKTRTDRNRFYHKDAQIAVVAFEKGISVESKKLLCEHAIRNTHLSIVVVINYESARCEPFASWCLSQQWDCVVADESHRLKGQSSSISKFAGKLSRKADFRIGLTGTPMAHSPMDVFGQYRFLDPNIFGPSFVAFRNKYAVMGGFGNHQILNYKEHEDLNRRFYSIAHVVGRDVLDLPEATHIELEFELSPKSRRLYKDIEDEFYASVDSGEITVSNALTKLLRLQQLTCGCLKLDDGKVVPSGIDGKADLLKDLLEDIDPSEPVVVFCRFTNDLDVIHRVAQECGTTSKELSGRGNQLFQWQEGKSRVLAVQIQAGGVGIDLTRARYCVYYSIGYSLGDYEQSLARVHRPGQTKAVTYYHLIASQTIDETIYKAIDSKRDIIQFVLERRDRDV